MAKTNPLLRMLLPLGDKPQRKVKEQLASALEGRERQAEAEIRAAVLTLHGRRAAARARLAEVQRLEAKVDEIEKRQKAGQQVTEELTKAKLDLLKSRGELLQSAADWNVAVVKLRQAMGLLVRE
jgi:outer membrane protein TolC